VVSERESMLLRPVSDLVLHFAFEDGIVKVAFEVSGMAFSFPRIRRNGPEDLLLGPRDKMRFSAGTTFTCFDIIASASVSASATFAHPVA